MSKDRQVLQRCLFLALLFIISIAGMIMYNVYTSDRPQVFTDVIMETTAMQGSNKTAERNLFYIFSLAGVLLYGLFYAWTEKKGSPQRKDRTAGYDLNIPIISVCVLILVSRILFDKSEPVTVMAAALGLILMMVNRALVIEGMSFLFICVYGICAIYRIYVFCGGEHTLSKTHVALFALLITLALIPAAGKVRNIYVRAIMAVQLVIPFLLLMYEASEYYYAGADLNIPIPLRLKLVIRMLIILMVIEAIAVIRKNAKARELKPGDVISSGACISIMSFNSYTGSGAIFLPDYHHPFENVIGFTQIFELGRKAFDQYIPVSGAYSLLNGAILSFFGKGKAAFYNVTENFFFLGIAAVTIILLKRTLKNKEWVLFTVLTIKVINYNRIVLILPIILLLISRELIMRRNLWLKIWFLTSLVHGLYYPLFGAAVCVGFFPLAVYELITYIRSDEFISDRKKLSFYLWWIICILPAALSIPWLLGTYKHISAMSDQTVYADGMTRFSQMMPNTILPYVGSMPVKLLIHYIISYLFQISIIWVFTAVALYIGGVRKGGKCFCVKDPEALCIGLSGGIILFISFSYTVIRMDVGSLYGRSHGVVFALAVLLIVIIDRYINDTALKRTITAYMLIIVSVMGCAYTGIDSVQKLESMYTVPEGFQHTDGSESRFGECFKYIDEEINEKLWNVSQLDRSKSYFALGYFGYYYLYDLKGDGPMEAVTVKGYDAARETIEILKKNDTIIGTDIDPIGNYYLYHWLVTSGDYVWNNEKGLFEPNKEGMTADETAGINKTNTIPKESPLLLRASGSWGSSMESLEGLFKDADIPYEIKDDHDGSEIVFDTAIYGNDADFLYLDIANDMNYDYKLFNISYAIKQETDNDPFSRYVMKKDYNPGENVIVKWIDDAGRVHDMTCSLYRGRLLIPLGGGSGWLLNDHDRISISMADDEGNALEMPQIEKVRFLKLRELGDI